MGVQITFLLIISADVHTSDKPERKKNWRVDDAATDDNSAANDTTASFVDDEECEMTCPLAHTGALPSPSLSPSLGFSHLQNPGLNTVYIFNLNYKFILFKLRGLFLYLQAIVGHILLQTPLYFQLRLLLLLLHHPRLRQ